MNKETKIGQKSIYEKWKRIQKSGHFKRKVNKAEKQLFIREPQKLLKICHDAGENLFESDISSEPIDLSMNASRICEGSSPSISNDIIVQPDDEDISTTPYVSQSDKTSEICGATVVSEDVENWETELISENFPHIDEQVSMEIMSDNLVTDLQQWSAENSITLSSLSGLLRILNRDIPKLNLKKDARTIMETPRHLHIASDPEMGGQYWNYGVEKALLNALSKQKIEIDAISLIVNIDGLPIYKSSSTEFWPILIKIYELEFIPPLVVGVYCGRGDANIRYN